ncbi:MAG: FAD:protein FMN transferase [Lachnospiraceae bacterium]|nr:FAD:protein FMN transferase [Lachnospiraceae bacterium]
MRLSAQHRKKLHKVINGLIILLALGVFVYFAIQTIQKKEMNIEMQAYAGSAMGTAVKKTLYSESMEENDAADAMIDTCLEELENQISARVSGSEIAGLNRNYAVDGINTLSESVASYLRQELLIWEESEGAFSPCIYPLSSLWGIEEGNTIVPNTTMIESALIAIDASQIEVNGNDLILHAPNMQLDMGAAGKGIACDEIRTRLCETNIQGAVVSVGGSILAYGDKGDGKEWHIGIQNPRGVTGDIFGVVDTPGNVVVSTSGDYEKYFESGGKRFHHIFDPSTGFPADNGLISVTIICENGLRSDAMSTACFVMGLEKGMAYAKEQGVEAIFVTQDKKVYVTDNMKNKFRLQSEEYELVR